MDAEANVSEAKTELTTCEISDVLKLLPHRYPFLMVDKVINIRGDDFGIGIKNVTFNEPHFQGHFPAEPVMPGVLIIEAMAQTAGVLCIVGEGTDQPSLVYMMTVDKAKFRRPVRPGDVLELHMKKERHRGNVWRFHGDAIVNGQVVAEADVSAMIARS